MNQSDFPANAFEALGIGQGQTSLADIGLSILASAACLPGSQKRHPEDLLLLEYMGMSEQNPAAEIVRLLPKLSAGDQMRLLQFAEAMVRQRAGKRRRRAARVEQPSEESWRLGC